jgi:uncharacterized protein YfaS (alpha-2-macroglobulin family)
MTRRAAGVLASVLAIAWLGGAAVYLTAVELPTGRLQGRTVAEETGRPLPWTLISLHRVPPVEGRETEFAFRTGTDGTFRARRLPAGSYLLEAASRAHTLARVGFTLGEGEHRDVALELAPNQPSLDIRMPTRAYLPEEAPQLTAHGFAPEETIRFRFYRVDQEVLLRRYAGRLYQMLHYGERSPEYLLATGVGGLARAGETTAQITQRDVEGIFTQRFDLPVMPPGVYVVDASVSDVHKVASFTVTRLGLIVKHWGTDALAYVTDLGTGEPAPAATVTFVPQGKGAVSATTDAEGLARVQVPAAETSLEVVVRAEKEGSLAFLSYQNWATEGEEQERVYAYTDRPVYRPGHEAFFKGIVRTIEGDTYRVPANQSVKVEVVDPRDNPVYRGTLTTDDYGSFTGRFTLNEEAATGYYRLVTTMAGRPHESGFKVAEYRKPEYQVEVKTERKRYTRGETIRATVAATYYFGAPVAGAEVEYQVMRAPYWYALEPGEDVFAYGDEGESDYYDYGEVIAEGTARTNAEGAADLRISTRPRREERGEDEMAESQDWRYIIQATVTDPSRKSVTASGRTIVTQGEFALAVEPIDYVVAPGAAAQVKVTAKDYEGKPVPDAKVTVAAQSETWARTRLVTAEVARGTVSTGANGEATYRFTPPAGGYYRIAGTATDRRGNRIRRYSSVWATEHTFSDLGIQYAELEIVADKKQYRKGDTAVLLINTRAKGATALLTIEGPRLYDHRLIQLGGNSTRVEVPIRPEYAPNCYVAVALVSGKRFSTQEKQLLISVSDRKLQVEVKPDKDRYQPRERATYAISTRDADGKPVPAQVSLGVVDESIYAIEGESAPPMLGFFYPPRPNDVDTDYSFASLYLDANKEPVGVQVRKRFPDTAYWNPTVVTDAGGRARVSFTMPDSLTSWRATARAITLDTAVGETTAQAKTSKDLLIRLEAPRFFTQDDRLTLSAVVHNYTKSTQQVQVWATAPGVRFVESGSEKPVRLTLAPDEVRRRDWIVQPERAGDTEVTVYAKAESGLSDGMALTLPILPNGRERVEWRSGSVRDAVNERFIVRQDAIAGVGDLRLRISPSLAGVVVGALEYLTHYPYGCTEQTMSAFLPDVVVARALRELNVPNRELEEQLPDMVAKSLDRLYRFQHEDGGWGWWRYDQSDPWMTAYVVYGLTLAERAGFAVDAEAKQGGTEWIASRLRSEAPLPMRDRTYLIYVLSLAGPGQVVNAELARWVPKADSLDTASQARLGAALLALGRTADAGRLAQLLWQRAQRSPDLCWWEGNREHYWDIGEGPVEVTALAFQVVSEVTPDDSRLPKAVRWLVLNRSGNHWDSTRDTAQVLYAITDFLRRSQELAPDYQATITVGGREVLSRRFTAADVFQPELEVKVAAAALRRGDNPVTLRKEGPGTLYYTAIFTQYVTGGDETDVVSGSGITVEREYFRLVRAREPSRRATMMFTEAKSTTDFTSGEPVLVRLTVNAPREQEYMVIEDPLPAGCEVSDRGDVEMWEWDRWYSDMEVRDEKVAFFARRLPAGRSVLEYHLRPQIPGEYHALPTKVYSMYNPSLRSVGAGAEVSIR